MSELERARRLPVFIDEDQWSRAYAAAKREVELLSHGEGWQLLDLDQGTLDRIATRITTAALRAAAQDDEGDVGDLPGVTVAQIPNSTTNFYRQGIQVPPTPTEGEYFTG